MNILTLILTEVAQEVASTPWYEKAFELVQSKTALILVATVALTALMRSSIKIYNAGKLAANDLVTVKEFKEFKTQYDVNRKEDVRNINNALWEKANIKIETTLSNFSDIRTTAIEVKQDAAVIKQDLNRIPVLEQRIAQLEAEIRRMKFGDNSSDTRRKD